MNQTCYKDKEDRQSGFCFDLPLNRSDLNFSLLNTLSSRLGLDYKENRLTWGNLRQFMATLAKFTRNLSQF